MLNLYSVVASVLFDKNKILDARHLDPAIEFHPIDSLFFIVPGLLADQLHDGVVVDAQAHATELLEVLGGLVIAHIDNVGLHLPRPGRPTARALVPDRAGHGGLFLVTHVLDLEQRPPEVALDLGDAALVGEAVAVLLQRHRVGGGAVVRQLLGYSQKLVVLGHLQRVLGVQLFGYCGLVPPD